MSKSLSILQTIAKIAKIVCKVIFILCIVGGVGCLLGLLAFLILGRATVDGFDVLGGEPFLTGAMGCITGVIACAGEAVFAYFGERYFARELAAGTPFTHEGAKEIFRLGMISIIVSLAISVASGIVTAIFMLASPNMADWDLSMSMSIELGLALLLLSVVFRYGAEISEQAFAKQGEWVNLDFDAAPASEQTAQEEASEEASSEDAE